MYAETITHLLIMLSHFDYEGREVYSTVTTPTTYTKAMMIQLFFEKLFWQVVLCYTVSQSIIYIVYCSCNRLQHTSNWLCMTLRSCFETAECYEEDTKHIPSIFQMCKIADIQRIRVFFFSFKCRLLYGSLKHMFNWF